MHCTSDLREANKHRLSVLVKAFYTLLSAKTVGTGAVSIIVITGVSGFQLIASRLNDALMLANGTFGH